MRGRGGFTLVEIIVALGVSSLLMLGIASLSVRFFRGHVQMDQESSIHTLRQLTLLATTPGGATRPGLGDSCDQTFGNRQVQWSTGALDFDVSAIPLAIQFSGETLIRGPSATPQPDQNYQTWRATYLDVDNLKCRTLGTPNPVTCLGGVNPPNTAVEFYGDLILRLAPTASNTANTNSLQKEIKLPIKLYAPAPTGNTYTVSGCNPVSAGPGTDAQAACLVACLGGVVGDLTGTATPDECWHPMDEVCYLTRRYCQVLDVPLAVSPPGNPALWRCDTAELKRKLLAPEPSNTLCTNGPPRQYLQSFTVNPNGTPPSNYVCQRNVPPNPTEYCENCYKVVPRVLTSPGQQQCYPAATTLDDLLLEVYAQFGTASGAANVTGYTCGYAPVTDPQINVCSGSCTHGVI